jgi:hypothetical protein
MQIDLTCEEIRDYSNRYIFTDDEIVSSCMMKAAQRGHMTRNDLLVVAKWKWRGGRTRQLCERNTDAEVQEISEISFAANSERLKIGALLALNGVQWPMASVILHFAFPDRYPILDVRVMRSASGSTIYNFERWQRYVGLCRAHAERCGVTLRTLDKALWARDKAGH